MTTKIWAHRGSSHTYIENTMEAFEQAIIDQADGVELDLQRTADGVLVVFHDESLKRLTGQDKLLHEVNYRQVQNYPLTAPKKVLNQSQERPFIPTLEEVLLLLLGTGLWINIELKNSKLPYPGLEDEVMAMVAAFDLQERVIYSSFNHASIRYLSPRVGAKHCAVLTSKPVKHPGAYLDEVGAGVYHPKKSILKETKTIKSLQAEGKQVNLWTVDDEESLRTCFQVGVDGIITNEPKLAKRIREEQRQEKGGKA